MLGLPYERPAAFTRDYLDVLDVALHGPGPVDVENATFTVHNPLDLGPVAPMQVLVAALGPVMLKLAGERADGTIVCRPAETDAVRERANRILGEAEVSPNYQRILAYGDARDIGDLCAVGDEAATRRRSRPASSGSKPPGSPTCRSGCCRSATDALS